MKKLVFLGIFIFASAIAYCQQEIPLYQYFNEGTRKHFYTTDFNKLGNGGNGVRFDGIACKVFDHEVDSKGVFPLFRYINDQTGDHYYSVNGNETGPAMQGYRLEKPACFVNTQPTPYNVSFFEYYNRHTHDHFYSVSQKDAGPGYEYVGIACYVISRR